MLADPQCGLIVPPDAPEAFADSVQRLLAEPALAREISRNAGRAAARYDSSPIFERWVAIFRQAAVKQ
jgi:glycosyltransferase involved in cell wall biosynthesis